MSSTISRPIKLPTASGNVGGGLPTDTAHVVEISAIAAVETGGTNPVTAVLRQGGATGVVVATISCATSSAGTQPTPINIPVAVQTPVYCQIVGSGTIDGSVHII
jgi:hypothetical protein